MVYLLMWHDQVYAWCRKYHTLWCCMQQGLLHFISMHANLMVSEIRSSSSRPRGKFECIIAPTKPYKCKHRHECTCTSLEFQWLRSCWYISFGVARPYVYVHGSGSYTGRGAIVKAAIDTYSYHQRVHLIPVCVIGFLAAQPAELKDGPAEHSLILDLFQLPSRLASVEIATCTFEEIHLIGLYSGHRRGETECACDRWSLLESSIGTS